MFFFSPLFISQPLTAVDPSGTSALVIKPEPSWFDRIVEASRFTLDMEENGTLPSEFLIEAYRLGRLAEGGYQIVDADKEMEFKSRYYYYCIYFLKSTILYLHVLLFILF